jgi:outer membrane protein assembly factor BamD (BamD/ComL family)
MNRKYVLLPVCFLLLVVGSSCCRNPETVKSDALAVESLYTEALKVLDTAPLTAENRLQIADIRRRAEILWQRLKKTYAGSGNPWLQILNLLISESIAGVK